VLAVWVLLFGILGKLLGAPGAGAGHGAGSSSTPPHVDFQCRQTSPEMRVPPPERPASSRRPGVTVNAADARLALATAYVGMWGDLESARGCGSRTSTRRSRARRRRLAKPSRRRRRRRGAPRPCPSKTSRQDEQVEPRSHHLIVGSWVAGQGTFRRYKYVFRTIPYQSNGLPRPTLIFLEDRSVGRVVQYGGHHTFLGFTPSRRVHNGFERS